MCFLLENFLLENSNYIVNLEIINVGKSKNISVRNEHVHVIHILSLRNEQMLLYDYSQVCLPVLSHQ
jgi:hypothetical protein